MNQSVAILLSDSKNCRRLITREAGLDHVHHAEDTEDAMKIVNYLERRLRRSGETSTHLVFVNVTNVDDELVQCLIDKAGDRIGVVFCVPTLELCDAWWSDLSHVRTLYLCIDTFNVKREARIIRPIWFSSIVGTYVQMEAILNSGRGKRMMKIQIDEDALGYSRTFY